ncbi:MAG: hypothetical protein WA949_15550 [Phormidesmis sp.]
MADFKDNRWLVLALVCTVGFMMMLDFSVSGSAANGRRICSFGHGGKFDSYPQKEGMIREIIDILIVLDSDGQIGT